MSKKKIVFIGGMPRSGTTLMRDVFRTVDDTIVLGTDYCLYSNFNNLNKYLKFPEKGDPKKITKWHDKMCAISPIHQWEVKGEELIFEKEKIHFFDYCDSVYSAFINKNKFSRYVFKSPRLENAFMDIMNRSWLVNFDTKFLFMIRNPLNQTKSLKYSNYAWGKVKVAKNISAKNSLEWLRALNEFSFFKMNFREDSLLIKYEDVISKQYKFEEVERFLGEKIHVSQALNSGGATSSIKSKKAPSFLTKKEELNVISITGRYSKFYFPELKSESQNNLVTPSLKKAFIEMLSLSDFRFIPAIFFRKLGFVSITSIQFYSKKFKLKLNGRKK